MRIANAILTLILALAMFFLMRYRKKPPSLIYASIVMALAVNLSLNAHFYPRLLEYQIGKQVVDRLARLSISEEEVFFYHFFSYNYLFYAADSKPVVANDRLLEERLEAGEESFLIVSAPYLSDVAADFNYEVIDQIKGHSVTLLDPEFLNPVTRSQTLQSTYIIKVLDKPE